MAKRIDLSKIAGYAEMSVEDKLSALESFEYEDYSSDVERYKNAVSKANSEAADYKRKYNSMLTEDEQRKAADAQSLADLQAELESLKKEKTVSEYVAQFASLGYDAELANSTANALADGDLKTLFANYKTQQDRQEKALRAEILKSTPKPAAGQAEKPISAEDFDSMSYSERVKLYNEDRDLYNKLNGGK